jgi:hypothetical protein
VPVQIADIGPPSTIAPGQTLIEEYWFGSRDDIGVCYGTVATEPQFLGELDVESQGRSGYIAFIGGVPHLEGRDWTYTMRVTNRSNHPIAYNIRVAILTRG